MTKVIFTLKRLFLLFLLAGTLNSCRILNPSRMYKAPKDYNNYTALNDSIREDYRLGVNDKFSFQMYTNDGFRIIDMTTIESNANNSNAVQNYTLNFLIDGDGMAKMPVIGRVKIAGKTAREAEIFLEGIYSKDYKRPFINIVALNKRVFFFNGAGSTGKMINLTNNNTRLVEVIAEAGGIAPTGKAYQIKIIRGDYLNPQIIKVDLSTIDKVKQANLIMQSGDIVYVESRPQYANALASQITAYTTLITSVVTLIALLRLLK
jgi:polysaccharide biosynthesis/export protein